MPYSMKLNQARHWIFLAAVIATTSVCYGQASECSTPPRSVTLVLKFSDRPSAEEIFKARVFEEPLVPIRSEPTAGENADLAAALAGYAGRVASATGVFAPDPGTNTTRLLLLSPPLNQRYFTVETLKPLAP
jgi:hypothetical protein